MVQGRLARPTKETKEFDGDMAQYEEFNIDQGSDVTITLNMKNNDGSRKNLTGYSVASKMKKTYNSDSDNTTDFSTAITSPATNGTCTLTLTNAQTSALSKGRYVYDVEISFLDSSSNTIVDRVIEGRIQVSPSVTK